MSTTRPTETSYIYHCFSQNDSNLYRKKELTVVKKKLARVARVVLETFGRLVWWFQHKLVRTSMMNPRDYIACFLNIRTIGRGVYDDFERP